MLQKKPANVQNSPSKDSDLRVFILEVASKEKRDRKQRERQKTDAEERTK